jgi:hypothetical protein
MARHEDASDKPDATTVASVENPAHAQDQDKRGGGRGASSIQVFDVRDLLIPAGTNWNVTPHVIGSFTARITDIIRWRIYLEWDSNHTLDGVSAQIGDGDFGRHADLTGDGTVWVAAQSEGDTADQAQNLFGAPDATVAPPPEEIFDVGVTTNPGTSEDIVITRLHIIIEIII